MKEYLDILRLGVSVGLTAGQRNNLIQKIKRALALEDYLVKRNRINQCLFNDSAIEKAQLIINQYRLNLNEKSKRYTKQFKN